MHADESHVMIVSIKGVISCTVMSLKYDVSRRLSFKWQPYQYNNSIDIKKKVYTEVVQPLSPTVKVCACEASGFRFEAFI